MINQAIADEMLNQMMCIWPSMSATMTNDQKLGYIAQLVAGLQSTGLDNAESVRQGFTKARTQGGQYPPSVPEFIKWCKPEQKELSHQLLPRLEQQESTPEQIKALSDELRKAMKGI